MPQQGCTLHVWAPFEQHRTLSSALMPPPERIACSRVLMVSMGYSAAGHG